MSVSLSSCSSVLKRVLLLALLALAGCASGPNVATDHDPAANLSTYRTFGFIKPLSTDRPGYSTLASWRLKQSTRRELERRGYRYADTNPELLVNFNVNIRERQDVRSTPSAARYGYFGYRMGLYDPWGGYPADVYTVNYKVGTVAVDLVDAQRKQLVWQGMIEGRVSQKDMQNPSAAIDQVIARIFTKFPATAQPQ
ncbi:MAG TPA: DUF4136 domain-containing protein [Steroidobacteraceae bacterium]